jgi:hypothetical protein
MMRMAGRLLDEAVLTDVVGRALAAAAGQRGDQPLTTTRLLVELVRADPDAEGWARVALHCRPPDSIDPDRWPDVGNPSSATWRDVPLSSASATALGVAGRLADDYQLEPLPPVAVALGLVADPASGAARALTDGTGVSGAELVELLQDHLADGRFEGLDLAALASSTAAAPPAAGPPSAPPGRPQGPGRPSRGERWDWPRARALLAGLGLAYLAISVLTQVPTSWHEDGAGGAATIVVASTIPALFAVRYIRRAADAAAVEQRRQQARRRRVDRGRDVAQRPSARDLGGAPTYSAEALRTLRAAADRHPSAATSRAHVAAALGEGFRLPPVGDDPEGSTAMVLDPGAGGHALLASEALARCLDDAVALAHAYAMHRVERGHVAAAVAHSVTGDIADTRGRLEWYFGEEFGDVEHVLDAPPPASRSARRPAFAIHDPGPQAPTHQHGPRLARLAYLVGAGALLLALAPLLLAVPTRVAQAGDLRLARQAFADERFEEAYRRFRELAADEPGSYMAHQGSGCAAAALDDLDRWAAAEDLALMVGMPIDWAGRCLPRAARSTFHIVVTERVATIVPAEPPAGAAPEPEVALVIVGSRRPLVDVVTEVACAAGRRGLSRYAAQQAGYALNLAQQSLVDPEAVAAALRQCVQDWPGSESREQVEAWVGA